MPLIIDKRMSIFKIRTVWFGNAPYEDRGVDRIVHMHCRDKIDAPGFNRETTSTLVLNVADGLDAVWDGMDGDCRKKIRRAEKEGFNIHVNSDYEEYVQMHRDFWKSKKLPLYDTRVLEQTEDFIRRYGTLFTAELNGRLLCGYMAIHDDEYMRGLQAASRRLETDEYLKKMIGFGNRLLVWKAIEYADSKGILQFDLGGYYTGEAPNPELEGINRFKRGFGGQLRERHSYSKDYSFSIRAARRTAAIWNKITGR